MKQIIIIAAILLVGNCVMAEAIPVPNTPIIRTGPHPDLGHVTAGTDYLRETAHLVPQPVYNAMPIFRNYNSSNYNYVPAIPSYGFNQYKIQPQSSYNYYEN